MTYRETVDHLGNPVYRPARFAWLRRIAESTDADGIYIIGGCVFAICIVGMWMSGWPI